jgi:hypothetical protein
MSGIFRLLGGMLRPPSVPLLAEMIDGRPVEMSPQKIAAALELLAEQMI